VFRMMACYCSTPVTGIARMIARKAKVRSCMAYFG
jgi:hypothetical protein